MRRTPAAEDQRDSPTTLIDRISAGHHPGSDADYAIPAPRIADGRHHREVGATAGDVVAELPTSPFAVVDAPPPDTPPPDTTAVVRSTRRGRRLAAANRTTVRRLAPVGVGAAVMLVAALVIAIVPQNHAATAGPELNSQLAAGTETAVPDAPGADSAYPVSPDPDAADLDPAQANTLPTAGPPTAGGAAPTAAPTTTAAVTRSVPVATPGPVVSTVAPSSQPTGATGPDIQAAIRLGWQRSASDEFDGAGLSSDWGAYDGAGNDGKGRRSPGAISVSGGVMTIKGDAHGTTGGMAWNVNQTYGRWEVRARFPKGDDQYHPVLLLWPDNGWPPEVDFAETTSASHDTSFYLHYGSKNEQVSASKKLDLTQWHDYAVEWEPGHVTGYVDGAQWFTSTSAKTVPDVPMHLAIQLDYFPDGGSPKPSELDVDYVRIYK